MKKHEIFVPGRVCLFGEHSDWAGGYRRINSNIIPGQVIITGTNQGMYATCCEGPSLAINSITDDGESHFGNFEMKAKELRKEAESDSFFSYACGVAYYMKEFYGVGGLVIDNYKTTLPVKKGLSSSAAFCVLVAKAFNEVYDLNLKTRAIIEAAYQGEIMTSSRCGRMDQGCAYGQIPVKMTFDGELMYAKPIKPGADIHMLIADLNAKKDTIKILADLNRAYPFPDHPYDEKVHEYLGSINKGIVSAAEAAITGGSARKLGSLMSSAQMEFHEYVAPMSTELKSPVLYETLRDGVIHELTFGGKGVGSQGDGCVQFVAKSEDSREELKKHLESKGMTCFDLDLKAVKEDIKKEELEA
jgi:mevalonate kinase